MEDEFHYHLDQAERSARVLRIIESYCDDDEDAYRTFTTERLSRAVSDTRSSFGFGNYLVFGFCCAEARRRVPQQIRSEEITRAETS